MCVMNTDSKAHTIDFEKYDERTKGFTLAKSVTSKQELKTTEKVQIEPKKMWVLELKK